MKKLLCTLWMLGVILTASAQVDLYTTAGAHAFVVPAGVLTVKVKCIGGGGAGGRVTPSNVFDNDAAGGGGGGAYAEGLVAVVEGNSYNVYVGAGGINDGTSVHGENSFFDAGLEVSAAGGETRTGNDNVGGAEGGKAINSVGAIKYDGGNGGTGDEGDSNGGGGGGAAGTSGPGIDGGEITAGGTVADYGGYGGSGGADGDYGDPGGTYGGGGGGSSCNGSDDRNGGAGASGLVIISWCEILAFTPMSMCPGGEVTVTGFNFTGADSVTLNGEQIPFLVDSDSQLTLTIPGTATSGALIIYTPNGASQASQPLTISSGTVVVSADATGAILTADYSGSSAASFQWLDCIDFNNPIAGATDSVYTTVENGLYAVTVTENGCVTTSDCFAVISATVAENEWAMQVKLYPVPSTGIVFVESALPLSTVAVYSLSGQLVMEVKEAGNKLQLDLTDLDNGIYQLQVESGSMRYNTKLVLAR